MPKVSIIIPVYNVQQNRFKKTLDSLVNQTFKDFEICISDGGTESTVDSIIKQYRDKLNIKYNKSEKNLGISENTNSAIRTATGAYICFLDHDDLLYKNAIEESVKKIEEGYDLVYTDEEIINTNGKTLNTLCKPDFSLDLLYSQNYICHFTTIRKTIIDRVGQFKSKYDGAQDYDYFLRVVELTNKIGHIPKVLYRWLSTPESTATNSSSKPYAQLAGLNALSDHIKRLYGNKATVSETDNLFVYKVDFNYLQKQLVDIIIPMKDKWPLTKTCIDSILEKTTYNNYQITILNNRSEEPTTIEWLNDIKKNKKVRVLDADFEFNWSKLQNYGINNSKAEVFVFLNNDTIIVDPYWLNVLCNNALRDGVGVVGPLLLYEDGTIQHAGVVVGMNGYADHVYKSCTPTHAGINYISPMVTRNVLSVTGACMAISKKTLKQIGLFNEKFIICGSDVELCIRAYENGLRNIYTPNTKLIHLESKSRSPDIPSIDFKMSQAVYKKYWDAGDPFYNPNLDYHSSTPCLKSRKTKAETTNSIFKKNPKTASLYQKTRNRLKNNKLAVRVYRKIKGLNNIPISASLTGDEQYLDPEVNQINPIKYTQKSNRTRINILIPSLQQEHIFGGIATAMKFFSEFDKKSFDKRIIVTNAPLHDKDLEGFKEYKYLKNNIQSEDRLQIVNISERNSCNLIVKPNDVFIATGWWTAYSIYPILKWQKEHYRQKQSNKLIYFIQDYEPYFYPWSSKQCRAESTYRFDIPTIAIFNSKELKDYFENHQYSFHRQYCFGPVLNDKLKKHLLNDSELERKKQIVIYGRPNTPRNAFGITIEALIKAFEKIDDYENWTIVSMGEKHMPIRIRKKLFVQSVGKLSLDQYAKTMEESYLGISLMVSPHPSYPPLEMSSFGIKTITNQYENKDLSYFNKNIVSIKNCDANTIAKEIIKYVNNYDKYVKSSTKAINDEYINSSNQFKPIIDDLKHLL